MPGITGIIAADFSEAHTSTLQTMRTSMLHERSYESGAYDNSTIALYVAWACHPGSFCACMPVWNEKKDVCVVFSGEDFTDAAEIDSLRSKGHNCSTQDAGYLVHLYEEWGLGFIDRLNGRFSGVLVDLRENVVVLFNDRYGFDRIYYHENADGFYFSSEAKSLLRVLPELRELDLERLAETFSHGCILRNKTLFPKISLLPAGSKWIFSGSHSPRKESYFSPSAWENQPPLSPVEYHRKLKETFVRILPRYLDGKRPIAMSLTGGLDGRMIMAWANQPPSKLKCYSFGSQYRDCVDVKLARKIAKLCRQPHETITVGQSFFPEFADLARKAVYISDGTMDVTGAVELYVNRIAAQIAPIRLTGNYGSEVLRGNVAFRPGGFEESVLDSGFARLVREAPAIYSIERKVQDLSFITFKQVPWHHYARLSVEQSQLTLRSPYLDNDLVQIVYQAPACLALSKAPSLRLAAEGNSALSQIPTDRGLLYHPVPVLTNAEHSYQEFIFRAEYAYDYGMPQWLAKIDHLFAPLHLERLFLGRHKFFHFRVWYRDELSKEVKDILLDRSSLSRPYLNRYGVEQILGAHSSGRANYTSEIHRLLTAELIHRCLVDIG